MSVVRLLGFSTLPCGCVVGRYRDVGSTREIVYVDTPGALRPDMARIPFKVFERPYWPRVDNPW